MSLIHFVSLPHGVILLDWCMCVFNKSVMQGIFRHRSIVVCYIEQLSILGVGVKRKRTESLHVKLKVLASNWKYNSIQMLVYIKTTLS